MILSESQSEFKEGLCFVLENLGMHQKGLNTHLVIQKLKLSRNAGHALEKLTPIKKKTKLSELD